MGIYNSVRAVTGASGDGPIDWEAVAEAGKASVDPGDLDMSATEQRGYADDTQAARDRVRDVTAIDFNLPDRVEIQNRHHWLDANIETFKRVMQPLEEQVGTSPGLARIVNTGSMAFALGFISNHVLGQYDPLLLADGNNHALYYVRPNIQKVADVLNVPYDRFRRWIVFHEVTHAAEFGAAPWLSDYLESSMNEAVTKLSSGNIDKTTLGTLDTTMTAVEGYAELIMDRAFDEEYDDLRQKLEQRRQGRGPVGQLIRQYLGLSVKRQQYERGSAFFDDVVAMRDIETAGRVWESPEMLPTQDELDDPEAWVSRIE